MRRLLPILVLLQAAVLAGTVLDRIAVIVDTKVIKDSDIAREIRVVDYLNGAKLDFSVTARKEAASRLIDQAIIRREIEQGRYQEASDDEVNKLLADTLQSHPAPSTYGITPDEVRNALRWQLTVLRFIEIRFKPQQQIQPGGADPFIAWLDTTRKSAPVKYREEELQ